MLLFGSNGIVASFIELGSLQIVLLRTLIGSILLISLFFISGMAMGASWMFLYEAYARIGVSISSLLYYCGPVIVMILSPFIFKEKLTVPKIVCFVSVLFGVFMVNGNFSGSSSDTFGIVCGLLSAMTYSLMVIFNKKAENITGLENSVLQLIIAFLTVSLFVGLKQGYAMKISFPSIVPILVLGLLNTGIGCYLYFSSIGKLSVQTVAICGYLEPLSAVLFSVIFLKEKMSVFQIIGAVLILGGAVLGELPAGKTAK